MTRRAVFLDRDGVLTQLIFNPGTGEFESPHSVKEMILYEGLQGSLAALQDSEYLLFLVSNQPSYAKGKVSFEVLSEIHQEFHRRLRTMDIRFTDYFYCFHHPDSIIPELKKPCACRKPGTYFLERTIEDYGLEREDCWMVGDQDTDMQCGQMAGMRTMLVETPGSASKRGLIHPDANVRDVVDLQRRIAGCN